MGGILIAHCDQDRSVAADLRSSLAELAIPQVADFVSLTSAVAEKPLRAEMSAGKALVVLLSGSAKRDSRIMAEAGVAVSLGRPVIAVILDDTRPEDFDFIEAALWIPAGGAMASGHLAREIYVALVDLLT
jgi:hypothetical protein